MPYSIKPDLRRKYLISVRVSARLGCQKIKPAPALCQIGQYKDMPFPVPMAMAMTMTTAPSPCNNTTPPYLPIGRRNISATEYLSTKKKKAPNAKTLSANYVPEVTPSHEDHTSPIFDVLFSSLYTSPPTFRLMPTAIPTIAPTITRAITSFTHNFCLLGKLDRH